MAQTKNRVGAFVWWRFQESYADFTTLAEAAEKAGLPPLFAPLPHPVSPSVAFNRMTRAAERVIGGKYWNGVVVHQTSPLKSKIPKPVREWCKELRPRPLVAAIQTWEPEETTRIGRPLRRPFHVHLWVCLRQDPESRYLPTMEVSCFFMTVETPNKEKDITDHVVAAAGSPKALRRMPPAIRDNVEMGQHLFTVLDRQRTQATSPEISDGVNEALEDVAGVKLKPGLFAVPGNTGVRRGKALLSYLTKVPGCAGGMFDFNTEAEAQQLGSLIQPVLEGDVARLEQEINDLAGSEVGAAALRTLWQQLAHQRWRIERNAPLLGRAARELEGRLETAGQTLKQKAGKVVLDPEPPETAAKRLSKAFRDIRAFAKGGKVEELAAVPQALGRATRDLRSLRYKSLLRRMRKLVEATVHVFWDRSHGNRDDALDRTDRLRPVLGSAIAYNEGFELPPVRARSEEPSDTRVNRRELTHGPMA